MLIIDTGVNVSAKLKDLMTLANGDLRVGRYLNRHAPEAQKVIKAAEAHAIADAGARLFLIYEAGAQTARDGAGAGTLDREWCEHYLSVIGAPPAPVIFNTVDYDAPVADMPAIRSYFTAYRSTRYRSGGYGSGAALAQLYADKSISVRWLSCSHGFRGTRDALAAGDYEMAQSLSPALDGVDVDVNVLRAPGVDIGDFIPFAASPPTVPATSAPAVAHVAPSILDRVKEIFSAA